MLQTLRVLVFLLIAPMLIACNASDSVEDVVDDAEDIIDDAEDIVDTIDGVPRKPIDTNRMGVNAFANERFAGGVCTQYTEIKNTLGLRYVRVLFSWNDSVQPTPESDPFMGFYDEILNCIPAGVDALVVLTHVPSWMNDSANWIDGNPRRTFVRRWVRFVANRYKGNGRIVGYQIGNEPNSTQFADNTTLQLVNSPENFVEMVALASNVIKNVDGAKLVVNGATTGIAQNFPDTLNYNKQLRDAGMESVIDAYAIHYYGKNYEKFILEVKDFLNGLGKTIWITESGKMGVNKQLPYVEEVWPFLRENVGSIDRIYYYKFAEAIPSNVTFGLRNPDGAFPVSDLYIHLRDR